MCHDVFISYATENKPIADAVCHILEHNQIKCWIAPRDITAGSIFAEELDNAIYDANALILILSEFAQESAFVNSEIHLAFTYKKKIIPLNIDGNDPRGQLKFYLTAHHWLDACPGIEEAIEKLIIDTSKELGIEIKDPNPPDDLLREYTPNILGNGSDLDYSTLATVIDSITALNHNNYTANSWDTLKTICTNAQNMNKYRSAKCQVQIDNCVIALNNAKNNLKNITPSLKNIAHLTFDYTVLKNLINIVKVIDKANFTEDSWSTLQNKISVAESMIQNNTASTQQDVLDEIAALQQTIIYLVPVELVIKDSGPQNKELWRLALSFPIISSIVFFYLRYKLNNEKLLIFGLFYLILGIFLLLQLVLFDKNSGNEFLFYVYLLIFIGVWFASILHGFILYRKMKRNEV